MGYVRDEVYVEDRPNPDMIPNKWNQAGFHYECHHAKCVVIGTARLYFVTEEEYLAHWNAFHAAVSPWYACPATGCGFVVPGEPDAFDCYMMHVQRCHVAHGEAGGLERESGKTSQDSTRWGVNPCFRDVGLKDPHPPPRKILVEAPGNIPVIGARWVVRQQMNSLDRRGFPDARFLDHQPYWQEYKNRMRGARTPNINEKKKCDGNAKKRKGVGKKRSPLATAPLAPALEWPRRLPRRKD